MVNKIRKIHLQKKHHRMFCGKNIETSLYTLKLNEVTCKNCMIQHDLELKNWGVVEYYEPNKNSKEYQRQKPRKCLKCEKVFQPKSKFNRNCGCLRFCEDRFVDSYGINIEFLEA